MAERTTKVKVQAEIEGYRKAMREMDRSTAAAATAIDRHGNKITGTGARMVRSAEVNREAWTTAGTSLTAFGAVGVAALGLSAKAAIDWESAWTGVLKTVDGTPEQLSVLEDSLRDMALRLPASAEEIAGVAEAAGQLGVKVEDVSAFTETMINLGETTNLTANDAATALARIANIMGTTVSDIARMGATIVDLGNNSATTEREIVELSTRLAAAGSQAGLSEADVLAFASALTSVGVEAEAGGTAMSKVFTSINDAVIDGGDNLATFAEVAGVSVEEFRRMFAEDAAGAVAVFVEGMGRMASQGESTSAVFDELELTDQRLMRSILSLGSAEGLLAEQLDIASGAWESNTALIEEAEKRYDTTDAKIQIAKNSMNEAAIVIGENLLPMLAGLAEGVADVTQWFSDLPQPVQQAITGLTGVVSVAALATGAFLHLFPRIIETRRALGIVTDSTGKFGTTMRGLTRGGGILAAATIGFAALTAAVEALPRAGNDSTTSISELTAALLDMEEAGGALEGAFGFSEDALGWTGSVDNLTDAAQRLTDPSLYNRVQDFGSSLRGMLGGGPSTASLAESEVDALGQALASLVQSGEAERAADQFDMLAEQWEAGGGDIEELKRLMPAYADALADVDNEQRLGTESAEDLGDATGDLAEETKSYNETLEENIDLQREAAGVALDEFDAVTQFADGVRAATEAIDENGKTLDENTAAGSANREALSGLVGDTWDWIDAGVAAGVSTNELSDRMAEGREAFIRTARQMGATKEEAEDLADSMGLIPSSVSTAVQVSGLDTASRKLGYLRSQMDGIDGRYVVAGVSWSGGSTFATGGSVSGPGTSTSDSIPAWLSDGEYVHRAAAHDFWGTQAMDSINRNDVSGLWSAMAARGFASGGSVSSMSPAPVVNVQGGRGGISQDNHYYGILDASRAADETMRRLNFAGA